MFTNIFDGMFLDRRFERRISRLNAGTGPGGAGNSGGQDDSIGTDESDPMGDGGASTAFGGNFVGPSVFESIENSSPNKAFAVQFAKSFAMSPGLVGLFKGIVDGVEAVTHEMAKSIRESFPSISEEMSVQIAKDVKNNIQGQVAKDNIKDPSQVGPGEIEKYLANAAYGAVSGGSIGVNTDFNNPGSPGGGNTGNPESYRYDMNSSQIWEDYVNSNYDKALEEYRNQADKINTATDKQTGLLDSLITGLTNNNNYKPITRQVGDQTYKWIPKANRDTASQIATLGQQRLLDNTTAALTGNANLNYLDNLKNLADMETKKIGIDKGIDINQQQVDQNEPGILDYVKGLGSLFGSSTTSAAKNIFDFGKGLLGF